MTTGAGKGRPAGMAILDPGLRGPATPEASESAAVATIHSLDPRHDDHAVAVARVRHHALRRLLFADVVGLTLAAFLGPLFVSLVSDNPASTVVRSG
ncbi:MAG: hypothetical protein JO368_00605, partial [Acidimicrobiales bacterium]|nr:hypothetical protein [Acidimicrobiales bacterium]